MCIIDFASGLYKLEIDLNVERQRLWKQFVVQHIRDARCVIWIKLSTKSEKKVKDEKCELRVSVPVFVRELLLDPKVELSTDELLKTPRRDVLDPNDTISHFCQVI